jgi:Flp pilus assembly protein TadG
MASQFKASVLRVRNRASRLTRCFARNEAGFTAIEYAIICVPFFFLLIGAMSVSLYFFTCSTIANAMSSAARGVLTGQFQQSIGAYSGASTLQQQEAVFKSALCSKLPAYVTCGNIIILAQANNTFGGISQPSCATNGVITTQTAANTLFNVGGSSSVVLMTACYPWSFGGHLPYFPIGDLNGGAFLIQSSVIFRTEPYI